MFTQPKRQRSGRSLFWVLAGMAATFGGWLVVCRIPRDSPRFVADPILLQELQAAHLAKEPVKKTGGDWPQWRGPNRDGISAETGLLFDWPKDGPKELWRATSGIGYSALAVAQGRACTIVQDGEDEAVVCWNADTGKELWRFRYACKYVNQWGSGPRSTPTIDGAFTYTVGATGIFHCLDSATGAKLWRHDLLDEFRAENLQWGVSFSPLIEGDLVLTNPGGPNGNSLAAFRKGHPRDGGGELVWKSLDDPAGYSSPLAVTAAGVRQVLFFTARGLVSVSPKDGKEFWRYPWETSYDCHIATPIALDDYVFISSGYDKGAALMKVQAEDGALAVKRVYETNQMCNHFSTCVLYQKHLYGFHDPGLLTCMELSTGKVLWKERGFKKGSLLVAEGHLILLGENGKLALAEASPEGYREKASCQPFSGKCWTMPVLANKKLYLRDEESVICLDLGK